MLNCSHLDQLREVPAQSARCEACAKAGQHPVALRMCLSCGHVGCCDSSPGKHARAHFHDSKHPLIEPLGGKQWTWCYLDDSYVERNRPAQPPGLAAAQRHLPGRGRPEKG